MHPSNRRRGPVGAKRKNARQDRSGRCGRRRRDDRDTRGSRANRTAPCRPRARAPESCPMDSAAAPCRSHSSYPRARWRCRARGRARSRPCAPYGQKARRESCAASTRRYHFYAGDGFGFAGDGLRCQRPSDRQSRRSAGDDEVDGLRTLALLVGLDIEGEALPLGQRFEPGSLDGGDVHKHVAAAIVRLDETVAALGIEELDRTCHGHRETPFPVVAPPPTPTVRRLGRTFANGESSGLTASLTPPAPTGGGTSKPAW